MLTRCRCFPGDRFADSWLQTLPIWFSLDFFWNFLWFLFKPSLISSDFSQKRCCRFREDLFLDSWLQVKTIFSLWFLLEFSLISSGSFFDFFWNYLWFRLEFFLYLLEFIWFLLEFSFISSGIFFDFLWMCFFNWWPGPGVAIFRVIDL